MSYPESPIISPFARYRQPILKGVQQAVEQAKPILANPFADVAEMISYHFGWNEKAMSGKLLRPTLCLLATEAVGGSVEKALPAAVSLELLHNMSLIYDDIQDNDTFRHGRRTVWSTYGMAQGITTGITTHTLSFATLHELRKTGYPPETILQVQDILQQATLRLAAGQGKDIAFEQTTTITLPDYLDMVNGKTVALMQASLVMGAILGGADKQTIDAFSQFGLHLGYAFQMQDDILGIWGDTKETGKPIDADIRRRKKSLPIVLALTSASEKDKEELMSLYGQNRNLTDAEVDRVKQLFEKAQVREEAQKLLTQQEEEAANALKNSLLPEDKKQQFLAILDSLKNRNR